MRKKSSPSPELFLFAQLAIESKVINSIFLFLSNIARYGDHGYLTMHNVIDTGNNVANKLRKAAGIGAVARNGEAKFKWEIGN